MDRSTDQPSEPGESRAAADAAGAVHRNPAGLSVAERIEHARRGYLRWKASQAEPQKP